MLVWAKKKLNFSIFFLSILPQIEAAIHVIGDSHAFYCFADSGYLDWRIVDYNTSFKFNFNDRLTSLRFVIHSIGPRTMHRVGRDGIKGLNIKDYSVKEHEAVIFAFGEVDVRCHVGKQCITQNKYLAEVLDTLAINYVACIMQNKAQYQDLNCIVLGIIPPLENIPSSNQYPVYGTIQERVFIVRSLNARLKIECDKYGIGFLDYYEDYCMPSGILRPELSDNVVHLGVNHNNRVKELLVELLSPDALEKLITRTNVTPSLRTFLFY